MCGVAEGNQYGLMLIARFDDKGFADKSFNEQGYVILSMSQGYAKARNIHFAKSNKILVTGLYYTGVNTGYAAVRILDNGLLDYSFGTRGISTTGFDNLTFSPTDFSGIVQKDGNILVAGSIYPDYDNEFKRIAIVSYEGDTITNANYVRIKKWIKRNGFSWQDNFSNKNSEYIIERSKDGLHFTEEAKVKSDNAGQYEYEVSLANAGRSYYRVSIADVSGKKNCSNIIELTSIVDGIEMFPNPAENNLTISGLKGAQKAKLSIVDITGKIQLFTTANSKTYTWNISFLKRGQYFLKVEYEIGEIEIKRFFKN